VCPDEINHEVGDITQELASHFGEVFSLGGLAGIPFSGKTGFAAYASHVPNDGSIFILFAPHWAISEEGLCGFYHRHGQTKLSVACGAGIGAYEAVKDLTEKPSFDPFGEDSQMEFIKHLLWEHRERIQRAKNPNAVNAELTYVLYETILEKMKKIVDRKYIVKGKIVMLGGI
jgi:Limiting CO2-inducible proteins B/C beta carbonyic anhydrases